MSEDSEIPEDYRLERSPSHLLRRAQQLISDLYAEHAGGSGLTQRQFVVLHAVAEEEGLSQTELVERTGIDRSTLADMVARMAKRGLLLRRRTAEDARANAISMTEEGRAALRAAIPGAKIADEAFLATFPRDLRSVLMTALAALTDAEGLAEEDGGQDKKKKKKKKKRKKSD